MITWLLVFGAFYACSKAIDQVYDAALRRYRRIRVRRLLAGDRDRMRQRLDAIALGRG